MKLVDNKIYEIKNQQISNIKELNESKLYNNGILTYNNQKINYYDYDNNLFWENKARVFAKKVFVADDYIYRRLDESIEIT